MIEFVCKFVRYPAAVRSRRFLQKYEKFKRRYSSYRPLRWTILYFVKRSLRLFFVLNSFGFDASLNMWYKITQSYLLLNPQFKFHAIPTLCWILLTSAKMETFGVKFQPTLHLIFVGACMSEQTKCLIISSKIVFDKCLLLTDVCSSYHERGNKEKRLSPHEESNLRFRAPILYHWATVTLRWVGQSDTRPAYCKINNSKLTWKW